MNPAPTPADDEKNIGGVHIKYLYHCARQLWLYGKGYRPEHRSDLVSFGEIVDETSFTRRRDIDLGEAKVDWVTTGAFVHETKSSRTPNPDHAAQVRHYCLLLERRGITVQGGTVHYPSSAAPPPSTGTPRPVLRPKPTNTVPAASSPPHTHRPACPAATAAAAPISTTAGENDARSRPHLLADRALSHPT